MSKETYMTGFNKMASACGVDANKLLCILGGNRRGGAYSIKSAQEGSGSKGFLANLGDAISSKWNGLTDNEKALALGLAGAGGGGLLGAGVGKLTGFGAGKGAITGALLGGVGGASYGMYSKEQNRLLGEIAKRDKEHTAEKSRMQSIIDQKQRNIDYAAAASAGEIQRITEQLAAMEQKNDQANKAHAEELDRVNKLVAQRENTIKRLRKVYSGKIHDYSDEELQKLIDVLNAEKGMRGNDKILTKVEQTFPPKYGPTGNSGSDEIKFSDQEAEAFKAYKNMGYSDIQALDKVMKARRKK